MDDQERQRIADLTPRDEAKNPELIAAENKVSEVMERLRKAEGQPNSGEEPSFIRPLRRIATDPNKAAGLVFHDDAVAAIEQFSQLRAERDDINNYIRAIATDHAPNYPNIGTIRPREQLYAIEATINGLLMAIGDLRAEHDKLKEENDKGKSAMKTMSDLFSVTSQKCGTLESDNARLAAEVEKFKGMCVEATDKIYEQVQTVSRLTAELEAAKAKIKSHCEDWAETDTHVRNVAKKFLPETKVDGDTFYVPPIEDLVDLLYTELESVSATAKLSNELLEAAKGERDRAVENNKGLRQMMLKDDAERDALAARVRELETAIKDAADALEASARPFDSACIVLRNAIPALLSTPPDEGEQLISKGGDKPLTTPSTTQEPVSNPAPTSNPEGAGECEAALLSTPTNAGEKCPNCGAAR